MKNTQFIKEIQQDNNIINKNDYVEENKEDPYKILHIKKER